MDQEVTHVEWLLWFRDVQTPTRRRAAAYAALSVELLKLGMLPIGTLASVFTLERTPGNWVIRVSTPGNNEATDIGSAADAAGRKVGFRLQRLPQPPPPDAR